MEFAQCREILLKESELVQQIAGLQNIIRDAVIKRDWIDFEGHFDTLGGIKAEFDALEQERQRLFAGQFYTFVMQFLPEQRSELTAIYRSLKMETLRTQMAGESLLGYVSEARTTLADFFEVAFPDRKGKMYTPYGVPVSHDMRSMVLNRSF